MLRQIRAAVIALGVFAAHAAAAPCPTAGPNLTLTNTTCQMSGVFTFTSITLTNSTIQVNPYTGGSKTATGNLELRAHTITIDATSKITAKGAGYQTPICGDGRGPLSANGTGDSLAKNGTVMTLTDAAGAFQPGHVGRTITIYGATSGANNGTFTITQYLGPTQLRYVNAAGVTEAFATGSWIIDDGAAGQGGCAVRDSGGGGAHFGRGGRGTNDISGTQAFPKDFEEDCGNTVTYNGTGTPACNAIGSPASTADCRNDDGLPTVAGAGYFHSIYAPEFGASGGDKGCRDGDGTTLMTAGGGGGRIVLAGLNGGVGLVTINGTLEATGRRGCGIENDSGGGGAGGTIFVVGDNVSIGATALVTAAGGLGGDTQGSMSNGECPTPYQQSGTCDDCGGGGGGGIISVLSGVSANINDRAVFNVNGALGGVCPICNGEAGGGVGELQISGGYVGEFCDGFDNDFDDNVDENLGTLNCGTMTVQACLAGVPQQCPPQVPACQGPVTDTRPRFTVIVDTSGSMLGTLPGIPTFGDGSVAHPGRDFDGNGVADDSRLFKAKAALNNVIAAYPDVDFALARYHQDQSVDRSCQLAHNFECNAICCTYDNPGNNTGPAPTPACTVNGGTSGSIGVLKDSPGEECINYAGNCGPPRRGADVVAGFGKDINQYLMWMDGTENQFNNTQTIGDYCNFAGGGDCELRGTGPTPLANSLNAVEDYLTPIKGCDLASTGGCRNYSVILLTDGAESCQGDPVSAAVALRAKGINTFVVGFSTLPSETTQLNQIAAGGGTGSAFLVGDENALANTLANIVSNSIIFETCNNLDDDCDTRVDEDFPGKGMQCTNNKFGACFRQGTLACSANGQGLTCTAPVVTCNASNRLVDGNGNDLGPCTEICNNADDDCDGKIDEGLGGCTCVVQGAEQCDGEDDDCDGTTDEDTDVPCGTGVCGGVRHCTFVAGCNPSPTCTGANCCYGACTATPPVPETCNGLDDDCDGNADGFTRACSNLSNGFPAFDPLNNPGADHPTDTGCETLNMAMPGKCKCQPGSRTCPLNGTGTFGACTGEVVPTTEICNGFDDDCDGRIDETPAVTCTTNAQCAGTPMTPTCDNPSGMPNMGTCAPPDCSTNCGVGQLVCQNGMQVCNATTAPNDDTCDGNDDDCDGNVDEDWRCADPDGPDNIPGNADDCPCSIAGQCNATESCQNGAVICQGMPTAQETCNCQDDNCNGQVDEGTLCPSGAECTSCQCAFHCSPGEFPCPLGKKCKGAAPNDFCVADPCFGVTCPAVPGTKQQCIEDPQQANSHLCVAACSQVTCNPGSVCIPQTGECKPDDCTTFPQRCTATQSCIVDGTGVGQCVANPCAGVTCGADQYCVNNTCVGSCGDVDCPTGQRCRLGACETDPCGHCPFGKVCHDSTMQCVDDPCTFVTCQDGQWCNPNNNGMCEPDPCKVFDVKCPVMGEVCKGGTCYDPASFQPDAGVEDVVTAGGGGGCSTSTGDAGLVGIVLALALMRRRRAAAGALAVSAALLTTSCDVHPYCLNCNLLNGDGGMGDAVDGDIDAIDAPDASTCVPTGPEACNNKDDDCDGNVDEGTLAAPVGQPCTDIGGVSGPAVGECAGGINMCVNGAVVCSKPPTPEQCDGKDNDCNGLQDEGDPGGGAKCGTDVGECVAGTFHCNTTTHVVECQGAIGTVGGQTEVCNNRDDDCDGMFDEMIPTTPCVPGVDGPMQGNTGECNLGTRSCIGGVTVCSGAVFPTFERCDVADLDQDCDGMGHNGYDILNGDPQNCGACGTVCNLPHAFEGCANGQCTIVACENGWHDNNGMPGDGCESGFCIVTGNEVCNGLDDDCSGTPDDNLGPPPNICKSGGECGAVAPTAMCMGALGWRCVYPGTVQTDPMTGAIVSETRCDTKDNDCDGAIDEGQPNLGAPCADTGIGVCQGKGSYQCDAMNLDNPAVCVITTPGVAPGPELCDDKDNNCDGIVDNPTGPDRVIDSMTHVVLNGLDYYIDTYEASRPDAATTNTSTSRACSTANRPPWRNVTWTGAQAACQAAGKQLCSSNEWQFACEGALNTTYPYGNTFMPAACNTESNDGIPGGADDDVMINTGALAACVSSPGVRDLSGNLKEWTNDITGQTTGGINIAVLRGGSYETPKLGATCDFRTTRAAVNVIEASTGFRCCRATAP